MNMAYRNMEVKMLARQALRGNWGVAVLSGVVYGFIYLVMMGVLLGGGLLADGGAEGVDAVSAFSMLWMRIGNIAVSLLTGVFLSGFAFLNLRMAYGERPFLSDLFHGFREEPNKAIKIQVVFVAYSLLCSIPLAVYEIVAGDNMNMMLAQLLMFAGPVVSFLLTLPYSQAFYLLQDFPERSVRDLLSASARLMEGEKERLALLTFSFFPLFMLSSFLMFLPVIWLMAYYRAVRAAFYKDLVGRKHGDS